MISCEEAQHICDKAQYKEASLWERVKLSFHLMVCKVCQAYTKNNGKLTSLCEQAEMKVLDRSTKSEMQEKIDELMHQEDLSNTQ
ncbi:MAG: hypothetical protein OIF50_16080 [Flavobacteriaceae bacterium]|nr:hypothetical protein [Flavobacteriaceae bacterium]